MLSTTESRVIVALSAIVLAVTVGMEFTERPQVGDYVDLKWMWGPKDTCLAEVDDLVDIKLVVFCGNTYRLRISSCENSRYKQNEVVYARECYMHGIYKRR